MIGAGNAEMAISGAYAGQLFGLLVGFGLSQLKNTLHHGPQSFDLFNPAAFHKNCLLLAVITTVGLTMLFTFVYGLCNNFKMGKGYSYTCMTLYGLFILGASVFSIREAISGY